jgi:L-lactate utilization protein LutC
MDYATLPGRNRLQTAIEAVRNRGIAVELMADGKAALDRLIALIPPEADVMTGASTTLREIGFDELLASGKHPWRNRKAEVRAEEDPARRSAMRRQATLADYFVGSVHAVAETGEIVVASATGSQIAPYAYSARHVIWVAGAQKVVPTLESALRRVREYVLPLEDKRMRSLPGSQIGSVIGKLLIIEKEVPYLGRAVTLLMVERALGL